MEKETQKPSRKLRVAAKAFLLFALWLLLWVFFYTVAAIASVLIEVRFNLPLMNGGLRWGAAITAVWGAGFFYCLIMGKRGKGLLAALAVVSLVGVVAYSVNYTGHPQHGFVGTDVEKALSHLPSAGFLLFTIGEETRPSFVCVPDRPLEAAIAGTPGGAVTIGVAVPGAGRAGRLEVEAVVSSGAAIPLAAIELSDMDSDRWNLVNIDVRGLTPPPRNLRLRLAGKGWVAVSEPRAIKARPDQPNLVVILVDTLRADRVTPETAPTIDRLKRQSLVFEQAMAPSSWTVPSTASVLTGLYPHQHGYISNAHLEFNPGVRMMAEIFKDSGYRTGAVTANVLIDPRYGFARGFDQFTAIGRIQRSFLHTGEMVTIRATDFIESREGEPFFLYLHYMDPHFPYLAPWPYTFGGQSVSLLDMGRSMYSFFRYDYHDFTNSWLISHPKARPLIEARYRGEISYLDRQVRTLLETLEQQGLLSNTILVVIADHGEAFGEHGNFRHGSSLFEEEVHVPMLVFDGRAPGGGTVTTPVSTIELSMILAEMAGIEPEDAWQGRGFAEFTAQNPPSRKIASLLSYRHFHPIAGEPERVKVALAAREGPLKIILQYDSISGASINHLYNLEADPHETDNLWDPTAGPRMALHAWMKDFLPDPRSIIFATPEDGYRIKAQDLEDLGYIQNTPRPAKKPETKPSSEKPKEQGP